MDGSVAIETNRAALLRIVASLAAMAGLARASHLPLEGRSAAGDATAEAGRRVGSQRPRASVISALPKEVAHCRNDPTRFVPLRGPQRPPLKGEVTRALTITRHLWRAILRLLRPAEAAARRLIIAAARGIVVPPPPPRFTRSPSPASQGRISSGAAGTTLILPRSRGRGTAEGGGGGMVEPLPSNPRLFLPLFDPLRRTFRPLRRVPERAAPRIFVPGWTARRPVPPPPPPPSPDDLVSATRVGLRIAARRRARRPAAPGPPLRAAEGAHRRQSPARPQRPCPAPRTQPLRGDPPPGGRLAVWDPSAPKGKNIREIDVILAHAHALALYALEFPDTS